MTTRHTILFTLTYMGHPDPLRHSKIRACYSSPNLDRTWAWCSRRSCLGSAQARCGSWSEFMPLYLPPTYIAQPPLTDVIGLSHDSTLKPY